MALLMVTFDTKEWPLAKIKVAIIFATSEIVSESDI